MKLGNTDLRISHTHREKVLGIECAREIYRERRERTRYKDKLRSQ